MKEGFDVALEMSGAPAAFDQLFDAILTGGRVALLGLPAKPALVDWNKIIFKQLTIKGIYGREMFETWHKMIAMLESGLDVRKVITHRLPADEIPRGFRDHAPGRERQDRAGLGRGPGLSTRGRRLPASRQIEMLALSLQMSGLAAKIFLSHNPKQISGDSLFTNGIVVIAPEFSNNSGLWRRESVMLKSGQRPVRGKSLGAGLRLSEQRGEGK